MPKGYTKRSRGNFDPNSSEPFRVSRSKLELFNDCPRCFYLDQRLGVPRTSFPAFSLNNAVDELMKREFDTLREEGKPHPLMEEYGIDAVPFKDPRMEEWRDALRRGVQFFHEKANLIVRGGVDDIWINSKGELHVVDYKATSKRDEVTLDGFWQQAYKRQVEIYQWLLRGNGLTVSPIAYFVYVNGNSGADSFDGKLEFDIKIIPHKGDDSWVEEHVLKLAACLRSDEVPERSEHCEYCGYREAAGKALQERKAKPTTVKSTRPASVRNKSLGI